MPQRTVNPDAAASLATTLDMADLAALHAALARDAAAQTRAERVPSTTFAQALAAVGEALL